jgi:hypothetical protein
MSQCHRLQAIFERVRFARPLSDRVAQAGIEVIRRHDAAAAQNAAAGHMFNAAPLGIALDRATLRCLSVPEFQTACFLFHSQN